MSDGGSAVPLLPESNAAKFILAAAFKRMGVEDDSLALSDMTKIGKRAGLKMDVVDAEEFRQVFGGVCGDVVSDNSRVGAIPEWLERFQRVRGQLLVFAWERTR
jgi:hypothetical protein